MSVLHGSRAGVNSTPELKFLTNSKSNSGIGIELAWPSPDGIGIELELPSIELELESELYLTECDSELPSMELKSDMRSLIIISVAYYSASNIEKANISCLHITGPNWLHKRD